MQAVKLAVSEAVRENKSNTNRNVLICSHARGNRFVCALPELW